jgi:hypothetical protein
MPDESDLALIRILETLQGPTSLRGSQALSSFRARNAWRLDAISQCRRLPIRMWIGSDKRGLGMRLFGDIAVMPPG